MWAVHLPWTVSAAGCGCLSPRRQGLIRVCGTWQAMSRDPPQRREARFAKRRCSLHSGAFCRDAGSAGHGATEAARPERSLQARVSRQGWKPARAETASLAPFTTARPARGTPGKAINRRGMERRGKRRRTITGTVTTENNIRKKHSGHITNGKGNGRRVSVARFPSGRRQPARGFRAG